MLGQLFGVLTLALSSGSISSSGPGQQGTPAPARPNIVLFTADTLRREHLGLYGYPRPTSPRLDALARSSVVFERAFAPMATTFPSHMTMLTGLYPHQHGHTSNRGAVRSPYQASDGRRTLAFRSSDARRRRAWIVARDASPSSGWRVSEFGMRERGGPSCSMPRQTCRLNSTCSRVGECPTASS